MNEIIFIVEDSPEGGYAAKAAGESIFTEADPHDGLHAQVSDEVGSERSLLVLCPAFRGKSEYPNLAVKRIPKQALSRCEWGHDDYSRRVENLPQKPPTPEQQALFDDGEGK